MDFAELKTSPFYRHHRFIDLVGKLFSSTSTQHVNESSSQLLFNLHCRQPRVRHHRTIEHIIKRGQGHILCVVGVAHLNESV